jgi:hypothetical protein
MGARFYDPYLNRFISPDTIIPDPANPQSFNRHSYVYNNPHRYVDPTGHNGEPWWLKAGKAIGSTKLGKALIVNTAEVWCGATATVHQAAQGTAVAKNIVTGNPLGNYRTASLPEGTKDLTAFILNQMNTNANSTIAGSLRGASSGGPEYQVGAYLGWMALVKAGAPWDFKVELKGRGKVVELAGGSYRSDIVANIHFGYVGRASGFSGQDLLWGAGIAQIMDGNSRVNYVWHRFDSPYDEAAIKVGIYLYEKYGLVELTEEMLWEALQLFDWEALAAYDQQLEEIEP